MNPDDVPFLNLSRGPAGMLMSFCSACGFSKVWGAGGSGGIPPAPEIECPKCSAKAREAEREAARTTLHVKFADQAEPTEMRVDDWMLLDCGTLKVIRGKRSTYHAQHMWDTIEEVRDD